jgi:hydrogenase maturation protein HypF
VITVSLAPAVKSLVGDVRDGTPREIISCRFHNAIAHIILDVCTMLRGRERLEAVALSGGVFQNRYLVEMTAALLIKNGFEVLTHSRVPPNDGGVSLGQAAVALARISAKENNDVPCRTG